MIRKRFYHVLKVAIVAAFLFQGFSWHTPIAMQTLYPRLSPLAKKKDRLGHRQIWKRLQVLRIRFRIPETVEKDALPKLHEARLRERDWGFAGGDSIGGCKKSRDEFKLQAKCGNAWFVGLSTSSTILLYGFTYRSKLLQILIPWQPLDVRPTHAPTWQLSGGSNGMEQPTVCPKDSFIGGECFQRHVKSPRYADIWYCSHIEDVSEAKLAGLSVEDFMVYNSMDVLGGFSMSGASEVIPFRGQDSSKLLRPPRNVDNIVKSL